MKPKQFYQVSVIIGLMFTSSCEKYVDIKKNSVQQLIETANDCQLLLNDYSSLNTGYPSDGETSADDYYLSDEGYLNFRLNDEDRDLYIWKSGAIRSSAAPQWQFPYKVIYLSNLVLESLSELTGPQNQAQINDIRGQALFFRAFSLWNVAQLYSNNFNQASAANALGVPFRTSSDINEVSQRGTVENTYSKIIQDLNTASDILPAQLSVAPSRPSKCAAYALLARVYLSMSLFESALNSASQALALNNQLIDFNELSITSNTPFPRFNKETIFHSVMNRAANLNPGSPSSNIAKINQDLIASYNVNDLRKTILFKSNSDSHLGTFRFTGNYEPVEDAALFNGLAVDEIYLIRAECNARLGNIAEAMADLNTLLKTRYLKNTFTNYHASDAQEALQLVLQERRKELVMRGLRWTDLRRLNSDPRFAVPLTRSINGTTYSLSPNDVRYTLLIPNEVIRNTQYTQNAR